MFNVHIHFYVKMKLKRILNVKIIIEIFSDPPVVTVQPDNITVNETFDILLFCEYEANPRKLYDVRWYLEHFSLKIFYTLIFV